MKNQKIYWISIMCLLILAGCSNNEDTPVEDPYITGYVMDRTDQQILVVSTEGEDFSETGGADEFYNAVWFSNAPEDISIGEKVRVWHDGEVAESYPAQATLEDYEILSPDTPDGAEQTEAEALEKALSDIEFDHDMYTVQSIEFDSDEGEWSFVFKNTNTDEEITVEVDD